MHSHGILPLLVAFTLSYVASTFELGLEISPQVVNIIIQTTDDTCIAKKWRVQMIGATALTTTCNTMMGTTLHYHSLVLPSQTCSL